MTKQLPNGRNLPWGLFEVSVTFVSCYAVYYILRQVAQTFILRDMDITYYGSIENVDLVLILTVVSIAIITNLFLLCCVSYIVKFRHRRSFADLGWGFRVSSSWIFTSISLGIVFGVLAFVAITELKGGIQTGWKIIGVSGRTPRFALPMQLVLVAAIPILEELYFRGFIYPALRNKLRLSFSVLICTLAFVSWHIPSILQNSLFILPPLVFGAISCLLFEFSRSLTPPILVHNISNVVAILLSYSKVS
jgi:membrane protease YdiL (CAAX protease family)